MVLGPLSGCQAHGRGLLLKQRQQPRANQVPKLILGHSSHCHTEPLAFVSALKLAGLTVRVRLLRDSGSIACGGGVAVGGGLG
jgi:hypothetical protein